MCLAVDDVGALAMIHALQNRGEAELLAVCLNEVHPSGVAAIDAINTYYGRGDIPVGVYRGTFPDPDKSAYLDDLAKFPHDLDDKNALSALEVYKNVLAKQPDKSVTIISVGFMNNLDVLLKNDPILVARKVKELVIMGAPNGDDHNLGFHNTAKAAQNILENWPSPLVFHHLGGDVLTGLSLKETPKENPVREAYFKYSGSKFVDLASHDQITVLYGVRGACNYFSKTSSGTGSIPSGFKWDMKTRNDSVIKTLLPGEAYARIIDALMMMPPVKLKKNIKKKIIYETDMCLDVDDVGGLAMLHAMANNNEVEILAVCFNEVHPFAAPAIDAINTWYGHGDIPVGIYKGALDNPDKSPYLEAVSKFPHDLERVNTPSALDVYQKVLAEQSDGSVTIISVGFVNNLCDLLRTDPDIISKKVKELVLMAGTTDGGGFNLNRHNLSSESQYIIENWPTPIVFTDPGGSIYTGPGLKNAPVENPVREAYYKFFKNDFRNRSSWDQISVLYGVRGLSDYFSMETIGTGHLENGFQYQIQAGHRTFVKPLIPDDSYARIIEDLMLEPPLK
ncbi:MAG: nucleoside hydrolase [Clostridiales bacterium]|nr:nucleoside hydrolase [Clostridiales bacterium]